MQLETGTEKPTPCLVVICGPTATGKSGLALEIARRLDSIILSADSRQVYRGFDIGTAKPSWEEQNTVPHHFIDICDPTETLTLGDFQQRAQAFIENFQHSPLASSAAASPTAAPRCPLLVGGTGLYIKSVVRGMKIPRVPPQAALRSQLMHLGQRHNYAQLQSVDPVAAEKIHPNDAVRTLRALEVFYVTGATISSQQGEDPPNYPILQIGLDCLDETVADPSQPNQADPKKHGQKKHDQKKHDQKKRHDPSSDRLTQRIRRRAQTMVDMGLVEEVRGLRDRYGDDLPLLNTLGYAEMRRYLNGEIKLETAIDLTALHTRQFAKRQRTWFRAISEIEWFDSDAPDLIDQVWNRIQSFMA